MRIIITEKQIKYLKSKFIFESDEVNQYGFTIDEMNQIEEFVKNNVRSYYEWLKNEVEKGKEYVSSMGRKIIVLVKKSQKVIAIKLAKQGL